MSDNEVPEGWARTQLSSVTEHVPNANPEQEPARQFGYVDISAIDNGRFEIVPAEVKHFAGKDAPSRARRSVRIGDVLFSNVRTYLRNVALFRQGTNADLCSTGFTVLRTNGAVLSEYLLRWVLTDEFIDAVTPEQTGTHYPATSDRVVLRQPIPLAPLAEQWRIVENVEALLARVNAARGRLGKVPAILKRFRQSVLAAACSGRLTEDWRSGRTLAPSLRLLKIGASNDLPDADEHLEGLELPESWVRARVDTLVSIQNGRAFPSKQYQATGIRLLRPGNLHVSGRVEWTEANTASLPKGWARECPEFVLGKDELLMNLTAQSLKDEFLGRACIKEDAQPALLNQRIARMVPYASFDVRPYLLIYFKSNLFRSFVTGLDTGSLIRHMHSKDVGRHVVLLPPQEEQLEIVRRVRALFMLADVVERRVVAATARADKLTQSVLAKAFRGELVPTEAELARQEGREYEPASVLLERINAGRAASTAGAPQRKRTRRTVQKTLLPKARRRASG